MELSELSFAFSNLIGLERNLMSQVWISCLKCRVVSVAQVAKCLAGQRINECRKLLKTQGISFNVFLDDWWVGSYVQQIEPNLLKLETAYMELTNQWLLTITSCLQLWFHGTLYIIRQKKNTFCAVAPGEGTASGDGARELTASMAKQNSKSLLQLRLCTSQHSHSGSSWRHA